jgi:glycosyltransferase involved in cell wall biosynthesis
VLDEHNVESDYLAARFGADGSELVGGPPSGSARLGFWKRREISAMRDWERRAWRAASEVVCVSAADAEQVKGVRGRAPVLIPNGVDVGAVPFKAPSARRGHEVLFVGLMSHAPNVAAARFLAREVMPLVRREEPLARLVLCGMNPAREVLALADQATEVTGLVPSVQPFLERAAVYANPLRHGAGTSLKVLEALAAGIPLVSTAIGVRGFELRPGHDYREANDAPTFAREIVNAIRLRSSFDEAAERGRALAERHDWQELASRFAAVVLDAARKG